MRTASATADMQMTGITGGRTTLTGVLVPHLESAGTYPHRVGARWRVPAQRAGVRG
jgi:hypothetical protein